jgi:hypothetical protein
MGGEPSEVARPEGDFRFFNRQAREDSNLRVAETASFQLPGSMRRGALPHAPPVTRGTLTLWSCGAGPSGLALFALEQRRLHAETGALRTKVIGPSITVTE